MTYMWSAVGIAILLSGAGCGDDTNDAIRRGIGSACMADMDCEEEGQMCLTQFKGGYCGIADCMVDADCPAGSACVADADFSRNFCFLVCDTKDDCNLHRDPEDESSCNSSLVIVDGDMGRKACRPPNSGT